MLVNPTDSGPSRRYLELQLSPSKKPPVGDLLGGARSSVGWLGSALILAGSSYLQRVLRNEGILAKERLMRIVLVVIAGRC